MVHIAAGVHILRSKLLTLSHPLSSAILPPLLAPDNREPLPKLPSLGGVLKRPYKPAFPGKLVLPSGPASLVDEDFDDDAWFVMYGSTREVATARSDGKRKRDEESDEDCQPRASCAYHCLPHR